MLRLQGYDFKAVYRPGKTNIADASSHLNLDHVDHREEYNYVRAILLRTVPITLSPRTEAILVATARVLTAEH